MNPVLGSLPVSIAEIPLDRRALLKLAAFSGFVPTNALASIDSEFPTPYVAHTRGIWWKIALSSVIWFFLQPPLLPVVPNDSFRGH